MKVIIISAHNLELIDEVVTKSGHAVVAQSDDLTHLLSLLLEHTPHVCLVEKPTQPDRQLNEAMASFPGTRFVLLGYERGSHWTQIIRTALAKGPAEIAWCPEEPEERTIVPDLRYFALSQAQELNRLISGEEGRAQVATDELRLTWMLCTAQEIGDRAEAYREAFAVINRSEWQEVAYRVAQGILPGIARVDFDSSRVVEIPLPFLKDYSRKLCVVWNPRLVEVRPFIVRAVEGLKSSSNDSH